MRQYEWGYNMMGDFGFFGFLFCLILFIDLILVGVWLWQQVTKKN